MSDAEIDALDEAPAAKRPAKAPAKGDFRRPGRPTKAESVRLLDHLLKVATREFIDNGYAGATIDRISARSNIGKMTIYRHFPSKERLFRAVVSRINDQFQNKLASVECEGRPLRDVLADFISASYDTPASEESAGITRILIAEAAAFPDLAYAMYQQRVGMLQPLADYLQRMQDAGVLRLTGNAGLAAFQLTALASGGVRSLLIPQAAIERARHAWTTAALEVFLNGTVVADRPA